MEDDFIRNLRQIKEALLRKIGVVVSPRKITGMEEIESGRDIGGAMPFDADRKATYIPP